MISEQEVRDVVENNIHALVPRMALSDWRIVVSTTTLEPGRVAACTYDVSYMRAEIDIDPAQHDDEADVLDSLVHELLHLVVAPFEVYRRVRIAGEEEDPKEEALWQIGMERAIKILEDGLAYSLRYPTQNGDPTVGSNETDTAIN
jgi:hypothetical protein